MGSLFPEPYDVIHLQRIISDEEDPDTGNDVIKELPPQPRKYISLAQIGRIRGSSKMIHNAEYLSRVDTELHMSVGDPTVYSSGDGVVLYPEFDEDGQWIPGTGIQFVCDGFPVNSNTSPWPALTKGMGGIVRIRRA